MEPIIYESCHSQKEILNIFRDSFTVKQALKFEEQELTDYTNIG